jgi:2-amino-4-hydroxy-6-hydroxymethyldihydropteridine diphosphokinase
VTTTGEWAFVALGSNVGDRAACLAFARQRLAMLPSTELTAESTVEETDPLGPVPQGRFLNQMVLLRTQLNPHELLTLCQEVEDACGRDRQERWGPRTLDVDIVRYGEHSVHDTVLTLPHPELSNRPFWQRELAELEPHVG